MESSSDTSDEDHTITNVLLGYASDQPSEDLTSYLGGSPFWLGGVAPPENLIQCKVCRSTMAQLLQLDGELAEHFPHHERRLHIFVCRMKGCSRRTGSIRALRSTKISLVETKSSTEHGPGLSTLQRPSLLLGEDIFRAVDSHSGASIANPFSANISSNSMEPLPTRGDECNMGAQQPSTTPHTPVNWTGSSAFNTSSTPQNSSFPVCYLDADYEVLVARSRPRSAGQGMQQQRDQIDDPDASQDGFESTIDRTFQRFADRLAQNPLQVLRYEFKGSPLLYSKTDEVGRLLSRARPTNAKSSDLAIPPCQNCSKERVFEMQITPQAITQVENSDSDFDGMEWGTLILGVCTADCQKPLTRENEVSYIEEWIGVQWEERTAGS